MVLDLIAQLDTEKARRIKTENQLRQLLARPDVVLAVLGTGVAIGVVASNDPRPPPAGELRTNHTVHA